jgi:hypothetical protein
MQNALTFWRVMPKNNIAGTSKLEPVRYAPLFSDWAFKRVLGNEGGEPLLMALLNDFLARVLCEITSIKYLPTEHPEATQTSKKVIFDIFCEDEKGNKYLIEMQKYKIGNAGDRLRFYMARIKSEIIKTGSKSYKFRDKVIYLFKNLHTIEERPESFGEELFDRIFDMLEISKLKAEDLMAYWEGMEDIDEEQLAIEEASDVAFAQGVMNTAKSMLADGLDPARVARITNLPEEQILAIR